MANYNSCYGCAKPARGLFVLNDFFLNFIVLQPFKDLKECLHQESTIEKRTMKGKTNVIEDQKRFKYF